MKPSSKVIAVFGSSRREENSIHYREAYELGWSLARAGYEILSGGYHGSMAAVSRGAREAGGQVIGVTCALFDPLQPNPWLSEEIKAPNLLERLRTMMERADGFVALRGGIGTLSEVTLAWSLLQTRTLDGKPLVLMGSDWPPILEALKKHSDLGNSIAALARLAGTPAEVLAALVAPPTPPCPPPAG
jgi:uncharacterized protein (TIGR00730 family)